jgi:hypothetical protein
MPVFQFGSGVVMATPVSGDLAANPTSLQAGTLQDISVDIGFDIKQLWGRYQFPDDVAKAKGKISGKIKFARFNGKLVNDLIFGQAMTTGQTKVALDVPFAVPATPFQATPNTSATATQYQIPAGGTYVSGGHLGIRYAATGEPLTQVPSAPATGQYTVTAAGQITFVVGDQAAAVLITFMYTIATGNSVTITNQLMGFGPNFSLILMQQYGGNQANLKLFRCTANKLTRPTKTEDYTIMEMDFESFADAAGNVLSFFDAA